MSQSSSEPPFSSMHDEFFSFTGIIEKLLFTLKKCLEFMIKLKESIMDSKNDRQHWI